ncbi:hypothetical protein [Lichenifustis flavocetrariae]|uniref:hypothetical protein n=1 Tax=Lichenifustis flavocetrariae TaxID=2949735 RepID=UPI003D0AAF72
MRGTADLISSSRFVTVAGAGRIPCVEHPRFWPTSSAIISRKHVGGDQADTLLGALVVDAENEASFSDAAEARMDLARFTAGSAGICFRRLCMRTNAPAPPGRSNARRCRPW